jgi:hypothetical protein
MIGWSKNYEWNSNGIIFTRSAGRPKIRWEHNMKDNLRIMEINNWTKCIQGQDKWKEVAEKAKTFKE